MNHIRNTRSYVIKLGVRKVRKYVQSHTSRERERALPGLQAGKLMSSGSESQPGKEKRG